MRPGCRSLLPSNIPNRSSGRSTVHDNSISGWALIDLLLDTLYPSSTSYNTVPKRRDLLLKKQTSSRINLPWRTVRHFFSTFYPHPPTFHIGDLCIFLLPLYWTVVLVSANRSWKVSIIRVQSRKVNRRWPEAMVVVENTVEKRKRTLGVTGYFYKSAVQ